MKPPLPLNFSIAVLLVFCGLPQVGLAGKTGMVASAKKTGAVAVKRWVTLKKIKTNGAAEDESEDDDASGDGTESLLSSGTLLAGLAGLTVVVAKKPRECKMCGANTGMASPFTEHDDTHSGFWPWLHYKRSGEETKVASGKVCSVCYAVFFMTSLKTVWSKSIGKYLKWKKSQDAIKRHQPFMQARKKYISLCNANPGKHRLHEKCPFHVLDMCAVESE